jgi:hypothetical protein
LAGLGTPVVDRAVIERIFGVRRRRAIQLMHYFGGFRSSQALLVDRLDLLRQLAVVEATAEFVQEQRRHERLTELVERLRQSRQGTQVCLPVPPEVRAHEMADLPEGIRLEAGQLQVDFVRAEDLLGKLFEFSQAAANDFEAFRRAVEESSRYRTDRSS